MFSSREVSQFRLSFGRYLTDCHSGRFIIAGFGWLFGLKAVVAKQRVNSGRLCITAYIILACRTGTRRAAVILNVNQLGCTSDGH